ncbi:MAG: anhydro-N-acetylmuramic acid kinase, partial [Pseudomonadota bacterium]|nr:anhydro-N-acetylmuramic acid kinase [Pseudomonadota bacterium]
ALLARLLDDPWFSRPPPKSSGRDQFHLDWVRARLAGDETIADVQATLLALSAQSIADALRTAQLQTRRVIACGGGVHNAVLMDTLATVLAGTIGGCVLESSAAHGLDPDHVEAMGFAWLAHATVHGRPGNLPSVTGARAPRILGGIYPA